MTAPDSKRRAVATSGGSQLERPPVASLAAVFQSISGGTNPESTTPGSKPQASTAPAPSHDEQTHLVLAYEKANEILSYVEKQVCEELRLEILVQEMGSFLQELGCGSEPLETVLEVERFRG
ncbi:uncharacterized protein PHACADRAFT_28961 [Phanerochaete carnosa HHB-10118-sp]|uniref:Uncharacterized protein n=1 Tax=Phanerochaete carnosa (strain HHB-10118-sp) TaxID=650164 RepID=K5VWP5_PHACS|nr:uncharacterized protein PHACADRAFT_28961 [Phanerochaete carnosa HHB-10118-sp]EKM55973.1 hypothetical protein PHACADRAFT_28961 [Phanerochaete carnosa HHB-10118-sp]